MSSIEEKGAVVSEEQRETGSIESADPDAEFGGYEERKRLERKLIWKMDCRMSILAVIYILNYVSTSCSSRMEYSCTQCRSIETMLRTPQEFLNPSRTIDDNLSFISMKRCSSPWI